MSINQTLADIETRMAEKKAQIDAVGEACAPHRAELDSLIEQEQLLKAEIAEATARLNAARGDPEEYLTLKREFGLLAATRMQLRAAARVLE